MPELQVRTLDEDEWQVYRDVRLAALQESPDAFVARFQDETSREDNVWRERMTQARRIIAQRGDETVGVVSLGLHNEDDQMGEVFGLWTAPSSRRDRVAQGLVATAAKQAVDDGRKKLYFWAGSDNATAIGFASRVGFRTTSERRPVRVADDAVEPDADEVAMVLSLSDDPTMVKNPYLE